MSDLSDDDSDGDFYTEWVAEALVKRAKSRLSQEDVNNWDAIITEAMCVYAQHAINRIIRNYTVLEYDNRDDFVDMAEHYREIIRQPLSEERREAIPANASVLYYKNTPHEWGAKTVFDLTPDQIRSRQRREE